MLGSERSNVRRARALAPLVALIVFGSATYAFVGSSGADVVAVSGSAYGYFTDVSLFGGPSSTHGPAPKVTLPAGGSASPIVATLPDGGKGQYGPAIVFGGIWPWEAPTGGPSGPITVSTQGTLGPNGSVTSSVGIVLHKPPRPAAPGGIGPGPLIADEAHSTCTANESGVSGSARFVNGLVETKYDSETQMPIESAIRRIPVNPPPNQTYVGTIDHVGDNFRIVLNEQIRNGDGSLTVNAAHMFLLGPIAVGEMIVGQSICGVTGGPSAPTPSPGSPSPAPGSPSPVGSPAPAPGATTASPSASSTVEPPPTSIDPAESATSTPPSTEAATTRPASEDGSRFAARPVSESDDSGLPLLLSALALVAGGGAAVVWARRRRLAKGEHLPDGPS